jgi:L-alanine-DL-glutamate epimerase-like enolase superfamily enzyme
MDNGLRVDCFPIRLPFRSPFTTAKGTKTHQPSLLVRLEHCGNVGWGEAPAISYYDVTVEGMVKELENHRSDLAEYDFVNPEAFHGWLICVLPGNPFLVCALDMAGWDLFGQMKGLPLHRFWSDDSKNAPISNYTIGMDSLHRMVEKVKALDWPVYKVKVGGEEDLAVLEALRKVTVSAFRVDANAAWTYEQACDILPRLQALGVEWVEQPLAKEDVEGMRRLAARSPLPLFADESCVSESDVTLCAAGFDGINIKLTKCGGITPALRMISEARKRGLQVMIGCMSESTVGSAAIAHLSPLVDFMDNDGPLLLAEDVATGLDYRYGKVTPTQRPGLGVEVFAFP